MENVILPVDVLSDLSKHKQQSVIVGTFNVRMIEPEACELTILDTVSKG